MFQQLATYLSLYKQVSIPEVGSFELVLQPAALDVASKIINGPAYLPHYSDKDAVKEHQLNFLALDLKTDKESVRRQLEKFGRELRQKIQKGIFSWKGIGKLEASNASMVFHPDVVEIKGLQPMAAEKVLRKNVQHAVLRGEQEVMSADFHDEEKVEAKKKSLVIIIGWIVVAISIALIVFFLYRGKFSSMASGSKMKIVPEQTTPTHK